MDDDAWARHANPWSVFTRFTCLPLIVLAIWSRVWIGWWALGPLALALLWTWANPRLFAAPETMDSWAAKGVMGERQFLNRKNVPIAAHHVRMAYILTALSGAGAVILVYGLVILDPWAAICGLSLTIGPKVWFVDRMVWIHSDAQSGRSYS
ncbi:MAG: DUF6653 family protein [Pseudomonadota bacterium]